MLVMTEEQIKGNLTREASFEAIRNAFLSLKHGKAAVLPRVRTTLNGRTLSSMGAILDYSDGTSVMATKVYPTINGQFNFVVLLMNGNNGEVIASLPGNTLTEIRTPATTCVVAKHYLGEDLASLALFGTGIQAQSHLDACVAHLNVGKVSVVGIENVEEFVARNALRYPQIRVEKASAETALASSNFVITATRAKDPLFDGHLVQPGTFVAAIGASKSTTREVDAHLVSRADEIVVEWLPQAKEEAGDLLLSETPVDWSQVTDVASVLNDSGQPNVAGTSTRITLYKAIGIGLADLAIAHLAYRNLLSSTKR
jgi:ornithine cyclodeaminase/alanine dehydrogenase-like protein (mu-crystallin family)